MPTSSNDDVIKQLRQRVDEVTAELERTSSTRLGLELERNALARTVEALTGELDEVKAELAELKQARPALTFDQLGSQLRQGLAAVDQGDDGVGAGGPRYRTQAASFELKVAIDSDGDQAVIRLPGIGDAVDPQLLGTFKLDVGLAGDDDPDLTGLVLVPTLSGATADGAADRLTRAGLTVGQTTARPAFGPPGSVVDQDPEGGAYVEPGTPIDVIVAAAEVAVPDVVGLAGAEARDRLAAVRLAVGEVEARPSEQSTGTVIEQAPKAGAAAAVDSSVDLVVAGPPLRTVPDLGDLTPDEAAEKLTEVELTLGRVRERLGDGPDGRIVEQTPAPGDEVERGSAVAVLVARRPIRRARPVPEVRGLPTAKAIDELEAADFTGRVVATKAFADGDDPDRFDTVVDQDPAAGTTTAEPDVGLVVVASGRPSERVRGIGRAMAQRLASAGLRTVGDLAHADPAAIAAAMGVSLVRATAVRDDARSRNRPGV